MKRMNLSNLLLIVACLLVGCDNSKLPNRSKLPTIRLANAKKLSIGTQGAFITIDDDWQRKQVNPDLGDDQFFLNDDGIYGMAIIEIQETFDSGQELHAAIDEWTIGFSIAGKDMKFKRRPLKQTNGMQHAIVDFKITVQGIRLSYEAHLLGRDGLYYLFINWTAPSKAMKLQGKSRAIIRSLRFPALDSDWGRSTQLAQTTVTEGGYTLTFPYQKSIFAEQQGELGDAFHALASHGGQSQCYWFFVDGYYGTEQVSEGIMSMLELDYPDIVLKSRTSIRVAGKEALQSAYAVDKPGVPFGVLSTVISLTDGRFLEIRCITTSTLEGKLKYFNPMIDQLVIDLPITVDAFPVVTEKQAPVVLGSQERQLLEAAERVGAFEESVWGFFTSPDGSILGVGSNVVMKLKEGEQDASTLVQFVEWRERSAAYSNNQLLTADGSGMVMAITEGVKTPDDLEAAKLCSAGASGLLVVRTSQIPIRLDLLNIADDSGSQLILRQADGKERNLGQFHSIQRLASSHSGELVLLQDWIDIDESRLIKIDVKTGAQTTLSIWPTLSHLAATRAGGWLVNGQPIDGLNGLYLVDENGKRELLISGTAFTGIQLSENSLVCASRLALDQALNGSVDASQVYAIPLDVVRRIGPGCRPFNGQLIQTIAKQAIDQLELDIDDPSLFTSRKPIEEFLRRAQTISIQTAGYPLPSDPEAFDRMIGNIADGESLSREGLLLLSLKLAACLFDSGAEWVEGGQSVLAIRHGRSQGLGRENPFAVAYMVDDIVMSTLYDGEGWWDPATSIISGASGRTILLGADPAKLREEHKSRKRDDLDEFIKEADADALVSFLKENTDNLDLRQYVYDSLLRNAQLDSCVKVADAFSQLSDPELMDVKVRVVLSFQNNAYQSEPRAAIDELRSYIEQFPTEPVFYLVLGAAYEESDENSKMEKARRCYSKADEIQSWGAIHQHATDALNRLEEKAKQD